jgi:DNA repair protein SbcD/Mre11
MKIAITADVHLRERDETPDRYRAFENVMEQTRAEGISQVIVAGDLFDKEFRNYSDFEELCREYEDLQVHVSPGNHDTGISERSIVGSNIHVYTEPQTVDMDGTCFLFLPYSPATTMAQNIAEWGGRPSIDPWVLIGHGDYYGGVREPNPLEPGTYMPLTRSDVDGLGAQAVLLGHIHKPDQWGSVSYVGSPCGLDISETGTRRFLIYDTDGGNVEERSVVTDHIYFVESFVVVPVDDEVEALEQEIERRIGAWGLDSADQEKVCVRVLATGYTTDKRAIYDALERGFGQFKSYKDEGPDTDKLMTTTDEQLNAVAQRTRDVLQELDWDFGGDEPEREQVLLAALATVYGQ